MGSGRIVSVIGAVIDVEFSRDEVPQIYDALKIEKNDITLEVQQQLGDGVVRTIAMGSSEGIARGLAVANNYASRIHHAHYIRYWRFIRKLG